MLSFIPLSMNYVFGTLLTAASSMRRMNFLALGGLGINLLLNIWLIPVKGAVGAAMATGLTQLFILAGQFLSCYHSFKWQIDKRFMLRIGLFLVLTLSLFAWLDFEKNGQSLLLSSALDLLLLLLFFGQPIYQRLKAQFARQF